MRPDDPPSIHDASKPFRPIPGSIRIVRSHVMESQRFTEALSASALWNVVDGDPHAAMPLKIRHDRAVYAATIRIPPTALPADRRATTMEPENQSIDLPIIIKAFRTRGPANALRRCAGQGRAHREWDGLWKLINAGVNAATPYLLLRAKAEDATTIELLIMQRVSGRDLLNAWAENRLQGQAGYDILERVGTQVAALMRATTPLFNRDHKPSNIIVDPDGIPTMIDAAGVRNWRFQKPLAMLAKLWIEVLGTHTLHPELTLPSRTQRWRVVRSYCRDTLGGWNHATPVSRREQTKAAWRATARLINRHGDPTPSDDPLSPRACPA